VYSAAEGNGTDGEGSEERWTIPSTTLGSRRSNDESSLPVHTPPSSASEHPPTPPRPPRAILDILSPLRPPLHLFLDLSFAEEIAESSSPSSLHLYPSFPVADPTFFSFLYSTVSPLPSPLLPLPPRRLSRSLSRSVRRQLPRPLPSFPPLGLPKDTSSKFSS